MRPRRLILIVFSIWAFLLPLWLAANPIDSLKQLAANAPHDTLRAKLLNNVGSAFFNTNLDSAMHYWQQALDMGEKLAENEDPLIQKAGKHQVMRSASNTAVIYQYRGLYPLALRQYQRCLRLAEELNDRRGRMIALNNIGLIKMGQEKPEEALGYFQQSQTLAQESKDSMTISTTLNNIGTALKRLNRMEEALEKFRESIVWSELVQNDIQIVDDLINIGSIQLSHDLPDSALITFHQSYQLALESEYSLGMPSILGGLSAAYEGIGRLDLALTYAQASLDSARALDITEEMIGALEQLADVQQKLGKFALANATLQTYIHLKDSLFSTDKALEFGQLEQSFDYEREELELAIQAEQAANARRLENRQQYIIAFAWLMAVVIVLLIGVRYARAERVRYLVVFVSLLFFFEFLLVLLDGYVDGLTGGLPIPKLAANVGLAAIIAPLNTLLERRLVKKKANEVDAS